VRFEEWPEPKILEPTDAIIRIAAACLGTEAALPWKRKAATSPAPGGRTLQNRTKGLKA
jgi:hypothetical protein